MGTKFKERYGLPGNDVDSLYDRYLKYGLKEFWGSFDAFVKWASESNYIRGSSLRRRREEEPHGPGNSFWYVRPPRKPVAHEDIVSPFCEGCSRICPGNGTGCKEWEDYFVKNWNENICRKPKPKEPPRAEVFRYEHPDLEREGIVFESSRSV